AFAGISGDCLLPKAGPGGVGHSFTLNSVSAHLPTGQGLDRISPVSAKNREDRDANTNGEGTRKESAGEISWKAALCPALRTPERYAAGVAGLSGFRRSRACDRVLGERIIRPAFPLGVGRDDRFIPDHLQ